MRNSLPTVWAICGVCNGNGTTSHRIECEGGGFTASEWNEACSDDADFAEDYFSGVYDDTCKDCNGSGKVRHIDYDRMSDTQIAEHEMDCRVTRELAAESRAERAMGC